MASAFRSRFCPPPRRRLPWRAAPPSSRATKPFPKSHSPANPILASGALPATMSSCPRAIAATGSSRRSSLQLRLRKRRAKTARPLRQHLQPRLLHLDSPANPFHHRRRHPRIIDIQPPPVRPPPIRVREPILPPRFPGAEQLPGPLQNLGIRSQGHHGAPDE